MSNTYFFRNDDVRETLDASLISIQELFVARRIPIIHAVEPANITQAVVDWLIEKKTDHPDLIDIMQHGYDHKIKNKREKGEFGGQRGYEEQYNDIQRGKELMEGYFFNLWFPAFNFPYAPYNQAAMKVLDDLGYAVLNSHYNKDWKRLLFYRMGHLTGKGLLFGHHVSWNMKRYPGTKMYEISMNISFIKKYLNEYTDCIFYTVDELVERIEQYRRSPYPVGLLLHHRYHTTPESIILISDVLDYLDQERIVATSMRAIYNQLIGKGNGRQE